MLSTGRHSNNMTMLSIEEGKFACFIASQQPGFDSRTCPQACHRFQGYASCTSAHHVYCLWKGRWTHVSMSEFHYHHLSIRTGCPLSEQHYDLIFTVVGDLANTYGLPNPCRMHPKQACNRYDMKILSHQGSNSPILTCQGGRWDLGGPLLCRADMLDFAAPGLKNSTIRQNTFMVFTRRRICPYFAQKICHCIRLIGLYGYFPWGCDSTRLEGYHRVAAASFRRSSEISSFWEWY